MNSISGQQKIMFVRNVFLVSSLTNIVVNGLKDHYIVFKHLLKAPIYMILT